MRAVAYCRKSTSGVDENGVARQEGSFERQKASIIDYAKKKGIEIIRWYEEPVSGKSIRKRKIFKQMVQDAKALPEKHFKAILFGEYDRFMRDVKEAMRYEVELDDLGIELHFTNLQNDGSVGDQIYKSVAREMAAEYSRELARKVVQGMVRKAKQGSWLGGVPPYGYQNVKNQNGTNSLVINSDESKIVEQIFKLSVKGWGHKRIATYLNDENIPSGIAARSRKSIRNRNVDGKWSSESIRAMLRNPVYKGVYRWNRKARVDCFDWKLEGQGTVEINKLRTQLEPFKKEGSFYSDREKSEKEWIQKDGIIPVIIPAEIFDQIQERFKPYSKRSWRRNNNVKYFLSGALRCACGNGIFGHRYSKILRQTGERAFYEYYRCAGDVKKGSHGDAIKPLMKREAVDQVVKSEIMERASKMMDSNKVKELFKNRIKQYFETRPNRLVQVEKEITKVEKEIDRLIEAYTKFEKEIPQQKIKELNNRKKALELEKINLIQSGESSQIFDVDQEAKDFLKNIKDVNLILDSVDTLDRVKFRDSFLQKAEVNWTAAGGKPRIRFTWYKVPRFAMQESRPASTKFSAMIYSLH